ncbi:MAG: NAD(+)/NADH kinase [Desulfobacterales bacterium]|nr:NAD(+)/NADH kinase [Desulfobacterales bacterium]MDX2513204.1 NAD(+)/NADH kinase [Desulfobacterales bacterium]
MNHNGERTSRSLSGALNALKKIGLIVKEDVEAIQQADKFEAWLVAKGVAVTRRDIEWPDRASPEYGLSCASPDLYCVFALGGDGTFLSAVRWIGDQNIPLLGVKFGELGFLAETDENSLLRVGEAVLKGAFKTRPRMRLQVKIDRHGKEISKETVLNDVVINRGASSHLAHIQTYINEHFLTEYRADGLIVSTPTGSTAYSLAAGGPIVHPGVNGILLSPICPFTLTNRPLLVPDSVRIKIQLAERSSDASITFDGQAGCEIDTGDVITIQKGDHPIHVITLLDHDDYFDLLKTKLRWSGSRV